MTAPAPQGARIPNGTASPVTLDHSYDIRGFAPGQTWYFGYYYMATRISGTDTVTITSKMRWWNSAGTELTPTTAPASFSTTVPNFIFTEAPHVAPAGAVRGRVNFTASSSAATFGFDIDLTACRVSKTQFNATAGATIGPGGNVNGAVDGNGRALIDLSQASHLNKNLDNIGDGGTYSRPLATRINVGRPTVDFSEGIHSNKNVDNIADGSSYSRILATRVNSGRPVIDFSEAIHTGKNVDNLADGSSYSRTLATRVNSGRPTIDLNENIHTNIGRVTQPQTNLFPYPRGTSDGRTPAQLGWGNYAPGNSFTNLTCGSGANQLGGDYYQLSRPAPGGAATSVDVFFDVQAAEIGNDFTLSVAGYVTNPTGGAFQCAIQWINPGKTAGIGSTLYSTYNPVSDRHEITGNMPSGTGWIRCHVVCNFGASTAYQDLTFWAIKLEHGSVATPYSNPIEWITRAGGFRRVGDQRNLPTVASMNLNYSWNGTVSYSASPTSATISTTSATVYVGSVSVSYSAMSCTVSGSASTTVVYWLYVDDPNYAGGTGAAGLQATTDPNVLVQADGRVFVGKISVTFPASGTGGGSGGTGGGSGSCPRSDMWVLTKAGLKRARDVVQGDRLLALTPGLNGGRWVECTSNDVSLQPCWKITSASGVELVCSDSTPITLRDHSIIWPADIDGHALPIWIDGALSWEACRAEFAGMATVQYIRCGGNIYAAGTEPDRMIFTHNPIK